MAGDPVTSEGALRRMLKERSLRLGGLRLSDALGAICAFYETSDDYLVVPGGDGLVVYVEVSNYGRGTRLEVGFCRLFRLTTEEQHHAWPALRLRLRTCFKWDHAIVAEVLPDGTWCEVCWAREALADFQDRIAKHSAYRVLRDRVASEAAISLERTSYRPSDLQPAAAVRQMWWGVHDVA